ncbi:DsrE/DsrF/TusD sulfur relay family protein [[Eubacterium] cellulosolvens]
MVEDTKSDKKTLGIMLFSGPYGNQDVDHMVRIAQRALDKGYGVEIFLYGDGVHAQMKDQAPKMFLNIGKALDKLVENGAVIKSCVRCSTARGYVDSEFDESQDRYPSPKSLDSVKIYSLYGFIGMIKNADKLITLGSA